MKNKLYTLKSNIDRITADTRYLIDMLYEQKSKITSSQGSDITQNIKEYIAKIHALLQELENKKEQIEELEKKWFVINNTYNNINYDINNISVNLEYWRRKIFDLISK